MRAVVEDLQAQVAKDAPAVGEQQRRDEQQQEQLGIEGDMQALLRPGDQRSQGDLYQRSGMART